MGNQNCCKTEAVTASVDAYKIRFGVKLVAFIAATISLSWFFEGWREINESPTLPHIAVIVGGTGLTLLILTVMAYWTYHEEKSKGTLKKKVQFFDRIRADMIEQRAARTTTKSQTGSCGCSQVHGSGSAPEEFIQIEIGVSE